MEKRKKVLIVIHGLGCGGAEKSLITFLNFATNVEWDIDLLVANQASIFFKQIPANVIQIKDQYEFENYATPLFERRKKVCSLRDFILQSIWQIFSRLDKSKNDLSRGELRWKLWGIHLPPLKGRYDLAISYMNGYPNYYVIDKVSAQKKVLWVHNEFEKLGYNYSFERRFYETADRIVTISQSCVNSILSVYPEFKGKTQILENISSANTIRTLANDHEEDDYFNYKGLKILSVGRLNDQKRFDLAIEAARILKDSGKTFLWYILGEGELRAQLEEMIARYNLKDFVILPGIKENPYPYIAECDIFVQSSEYEGKSIVLDEAKILCKPIVVTNYKTVGNSIIDDVNGKIVDIDSQSIAAGIQELINNKETALRYTNELRNEKNGNEDELKKYIDLFQELLNDCD